MGMISSPARARPGIERDGTRQVLLARRAGSWTCSAPRWWPRCSAGLGFDRLVAKRWVIRTQPSALRDSSESHPGILKLPELMARTVDRCGPGRSRGLARAPFRGV